MKKRLISLFLCLAMVLALIPSAIAAETYDVWVDGVQVTDANKGNVLGNGTVSYNPTTQTLTLRDAVLTKSHNHVVIKSEGDLTIYSAGSNRIELDAAEPSHALAINSKGNLRLTGPGALTIQDSGTDHSAISASSMSVDMSGKLAIAANYHAIFAPNGVELSGNGDVSISGEQTCIAVNFGDVILSGNGTVTLTSPWECIGAGGNVVLSGGGNRTFNGTRPIDTDKDLTISGSGDLRVESDNIGFKVSGNVVISGSGRVTVTAGGDTANPYIQNRGIELNGDGSLTISGTGTVNIYGSNSAVYLSGDDGRVLLDGSASPVSFRAGTGGAAIENPKTVVAGTQLSRYRASGSPQSTSLVYTCEEKLEDFTVRTSVDPSTYALTVNWDDVPGAVYYEARLMRYDPSEGMYLQSGTTKSVSHGTSCVFYADRFAQSNIIGDDDWKVILYALDGNSSRLAGGQSKRFAVNMPKLDTPVPVLDPDGYLYWNAVPHATLYTVILKDEKLNTIASSVTPYTHFHFASYMGEGNAYRCYVYAIDENNGHLASKIGSSQRVVRYPGKFYGIWIGKTPITSENKDDVLGDGTVRFYPAGEYRGENTTVPGDTYGKNYPTLVLNNFTMKTNASHADIADAAQIFIKSDLNLVLKGTNNLYKYGSAHGIYIAEGRYVWFYGSGTLNVDTSRNDYDAMVCESSAVSFCENVKVNLTGAHGLRYNMAGVGDDYITIMDHARVNCYAKQTSDNRDYPAMDVCSIGIIGDGWLICEAQYNGEALYDWGDPFPNKYYDIKILKIGEYQSDGIQPYTPAEGIDVTGGVSSLSCRYISIHSKTPADCGGNAGNCALTQFTDAPKYTNWAHAGIEYCVRRGLMSGTSATTFEPKMTMSRAMLVTVLYRMEGEPGPGETTFTDVKPGRWYSDAVSWAADKGIVAGMGGGKFEPNGNVTREQIVTFLFRYAGYKGRDTDINYDLSNFADASKVGKWYVNAMKWAVYMNLINGSVSNGKFYLTPQGDANREQVAAMLMRFYKNMEG